VEVFYLDFLKNALEPSDHVAHLFVEHVIPRMMEEYAEKSAKGGDHKNRDEDTKRKFEEKVDQSMVSHLLNGIFPTLRLLNCLDTEHLGPGPFSDVERSIYILSYLMHDVDKIIGIHGLNTLTREDIELAKTHVATELQKIAADKFFPDVALYLEDITYLVVNTQQKYGTHLHTFLWKLQLRERRLLLLRRLCTYSDQIAYLVSSPSAICLSKETTLLSTILAEMSNDELVFTYHQLREVRGLLTNVVNNGMVELFQKEGNRSVWPYLFFSDGVVYIKRKSCQITIAKEQIVATVQERLKYTCATAIRNFAPGFKFSIQGIAKHPGYYFEFLNLEEYFELLADFTIKGTKKDVTGIPFAKLRQMQASGEIPADLFLDFPAGDLQISIISRFLSVVFATILGEMLPTKQKELRIQVEQAVVEHLGLKPYWEQARSIPNKGGVEYRWFWLGGCYWSHHRGSESYNGENNLLAVFQSTLRLVLTMAGEELRKQMPHLYLDNLAHYLDSIVEVPFSVRPQGIFPDFAAEMERYIAAKSEKRKKESMCTLCNSAYPTEEQSENAVLFQPWVYKNKLSLYAGKNAGGICAICALELMLRQITLKGQLRLTGGKFEALMTKYIAVYPNFFFTAETGAMVQGILEQLQDINFFSIRRELDRKDITISTLLKLDTFTAATENQKKLDPFIYKDEDDEDIQIDETDDSNKGEGSEEKADELAERSYLKFAQDTYPGMCFVGMKAGKDNDDTSAWAMPTFLALALPLVTNTKVVISEMPLPLFSSGHDFRETVVFDAPHAFLVRLLKKDHLRVNELLYKLKVLSSIYTVNLDTYARKGKPEWKHLSAIARDLETDPLYLFSYLRKQDRRESFYPAEVEQYIHIYKEVLEEDLSRIEHCVDNYIAFYRGGYNTHSIVKPIDIVAKAIINSPLNIEKEDLLWQMRGELASWLDRVRGRHAGGYAVFWKWQDVETKEAEAIKIFVETFYEEIFRVYCQEERGLLRNRINRIKDGCEAYYTYQRGKRHFEEHEETPEEITTP
jgi:CRISPR-associated protein Csc3